MLSLEIAKKLKDNGFIPKEVLKYGNDYIDAYKECDDVYIPTLSELIDACGDGQFELRRVCIEGKNQWRAAMSFMSTGGVCGKIGEGETPEEAVANLWLEVRVK